VHIRLNQDENVLEYWISDETLVWTVPVRDIVLVAEYTTNQGPTADDYYLVFVWAANGVLRFATADFYAAGCFETVNLLAKQWGTNLEFGLIHSTDWASRVMWPPELAGQEYFEFREARPKTLGERLRKIALGPAIEYSPCETVRAFLASHSGR
jgi:hypothetical protein